MDGGQVAITGFTFQAVIAVLDSVTSKPWAQMTIEPTGSTKVDIRWVLADGTVEHVQVKHSHARRAP